MGIEHQSLELLRCQRVAHHSRPPAAYAMTVGTTSDLGRDDIKIHNPKPHAPEG